MRKEYLHISADACEKCKAPVVAGWLAVRESEIEKETQIRRVGAICLSCGHRPERISEPVNALQFPPVEWKCAIRPKSHGKNSGGSERRTWEGKETPAATLLYA